MSAPIIRIHPEKQPENPSTQVYPPQPEASPVVNYLGFNRLAALVIQSNEVRESFVDNMKSAGYTVTHWIAKPSPTAIPGEYFAVKPPISDLSVLQSVLLSSGIKTELFGTNIINPDENAAILYDARDKEDQVRLTNDFSQAS